MSVIEILETLKSYSYNVDIYLFGSILKNKSVKNDIDLLILYKSEKELSQKKIDLERLSVYYPLDIYYMNLDEEKELDFINTVKAIRVKDIEVKKYEA